MVSVGLAMTVVSVSGGGIPIPGFVFVPRNFWYVVRASVKVGMS